MEAVVARCWDILPKVSRSFALCIKLMPEPMGGQMMVSYLIYRVIDTIEDSNAPLEMKKQLFDEFMGLLAKREFNAEATRECRENLCGKLNYTYEKELLESLEAVMKTYYAQPAHAQRQILKWGRVMAKGMYEFQQKPIDTIADQNKYCYYVAGVIGYLFTDLLFYNGIITRKLRRKLLKYAHGFGLALQKVNILRDVARDVISKRLFWPRMLLAKYGLVYDTLCLKEKRAEAMAVLNEQVADARHYIHDAIQYVMLLPEKALGIRKFCIIPLFMAIESYVACSNSGEVFESEKSVKISRLQVCDIVAKAEIWGGSNERLLEWFASSMGEPKATVQTYAR